MTRIGPLSPLAAPQSTLPAARPPRASPFGDRLKAPKPDPPPELTQLLTDVRADERRLDRYVRRALSGAQLDLQELVAMQRLVHRYARRVELLSKVVDRLNSAVKQTLNTPL